MQLQGVNRLSLIPLKDIVVCFYFQLKEIADRKTAKPFCRLFGQLEEYSQDIDLGSLKNLI